MDPPAASGPEEHGRGKQSGPLDPAERAEYERLRRTLGARHRRLRLWGASLLLTLAVLLAPVTVVATWVNSEVTDVDRYEQTVSPLARDPAVQNLMIDRVTDGLVENIDVRKITDAIADTLADRDAPRFLVDAAESLDEELRSGLTAGVRFAVEKVVTSDAFAKAWDSINRGAHTVATNVLTGEGGGALEVKGDTITLNVGTVIEELQKQLIGVTLVEAEDIPGADKSIVLARNENLSEARDGARWLGVVAPWLPLVVVVLGGLGIWVAPSRRVALMAGGVGTGIMMCGLLVGLAVMRQICLDAVNQGTQSQDAAAAVYDTLVRFLRQAIFTVLLTALLTVIAGYLYGPGRGAAAVRSAAARTTETAGHALARTGLTTGAVGQWLRTNRPLTTGAVIGAGGLTLFLWNYPTPASVALLLLLVVVVLVILGVLAAAADEAEQRLQTGHRRYALNKAPVVSVSPIKGCSCQTWMIPANPERPPEGMSHMAISNRVALRTTALMFSGALFLAACSSGSDGGQTNSTTGTTPTATGTQVTVTETEYALKLSRTSFTPGTYTFIADDAGRTTHALEIEGPGVSDARTKNIQGGEKASVTVTLMKGSYELYCPVDGHKELGMEQHIQVG